jgi:signal transduction histidine kinase/ActR/RegA family two-component response regulator
MRASRFAGGLAINLLLAATYFGTAKAALRVATVNASVTPVWPPSGIALAALLVFGRRVWPGIFLGAFWANITTQGSFWTVATIAGGNTSEALLGAYLVNRFANGRDAFLRPQDVFKFAGLGALLSAMVGATVGAASLALGSYARWADFGAVWPTWWLGDAVGALLVTPLLVLWAGDRVLRWSRPRWLELISWAVVLCLVARTVFGPLFGIGHSLAFLCIPLIIWLAFRFGPRETATGIFLLAGLVLWGTLQGYGPYARGVQNENSSMLLLHAYMSTLGVMALAVAAAVAERERIACVLGQSREQLRQAQKMEAVGRLAGGVAHDFNNILTAIIGYSELALRQLPRDQPWRVHVEEIKRAGERAAVLTRQLLAFSRRQMLEPQLLDLNSVVVESASILRRLIEDDVELTTSFGPGRGVVRADPGQLEQVLINLAVNARDAMPGGGRLTIATEDVDLERPLVQGRFSIPAGAYVKMTVSDTGKGMDKEVLAHIFEPFFTTKELGKGTGLGLATVYGIVKQSDGYIAAESLPAGGSRFTIFLPHCGVSGASRPALSPDPVAPRSRGAETVLVVDDEPLVRGLVSTILGELGYHVVQAGNGGEALAWEAENSEPVHLLLTDVVMPGMSGIELAAELRRRRPECRVLFMSGYSSDVVARPEPTAGELLRKPFTQEELARRVHEGLREPSPAPATAGLL